jgi:eukaryotic-like serine/threonine-protein kinase
VQLALDDTACDSPRARAEHARRIGRYRVEHELGAGGMGVVYSGFDPLLGRRVAIKLVRQELSEIDELETRFLNEARAAARISDPGIVQIFDFGKHTDGSLFIVMELLEGEQLEERLGRHGPLPIVDALLLMRQIASTVGAAHARGIVHRDLKPENIFLVRDSARERAKVLDFGIAKLFSDQITDQAVVLGTPCYMAPEQCFSSNVDARADVYALGCMLYAMLTGSPPFEAPAMQQVTNMHMHAPVPRASNRRAAVPMVVDALIARCLAKDPTQRFAGGSELAAAIDSLIDEPELPTQKRQSSGSDWNRRAATQPAEVPLARSYLIASLVGLIVGLIVVAGLIASRGGIAAQTAASRPARSTITVEPIVDPGR